MRLALHACCGPCLLEPFDALVAEGHEVVVVYANPNIHPSEEYARRLGVLVAHAAEAGIEVVELDYDPSRWAAGPGVHGADQKNRCRACYRLRLNDVAEWAAANGFDALATTLTVSPYQDAAAIAEEGARAAEAHGLTYLARDYRERYPDATRRSRELGMYRQNYCGCAPSQAEASAQREARKARRAAERERRSAAGD